MKKILHLLLFFGSVANCLAQEQNSIRLTSEQIEAQFIKQNLLLIAQQMNVAIADAAVLQAKLWHNPQLSANDINLWSSESQRNGETIPPLFGSFARNTQFSIELSQLIQTANKRGKRVRMENVSKDMAIQEFEEVLRSLKIELRKLINETVYLQAYHQVLSTQNETLERLITVYQKQVQLGNMAKNELLRLQASALELENEINDIQISLNEQQKGLKALLNLNPLSNIEVDATTENKISPEQIQLPYLLSQASENRPDVKRQNLQSLYFKQSLSYEKSLRVPDINLGVSYDRRGGVWRDFVSLGVSFDIPLLNRNQGNIKAAKLAHQQSQYMEQQVVNMAQQEVVEAYSNYARIYVFHKKIKENDLLSELDSMLDVYTKNFMNKNISILEYIDFMETYKANKQTVLTTNKQLSILFEELQYTTGIELK